MTPCPGGAAYVMRDGAMAWEPMPGADDSQLKSVWGASSTEVFAVGRDGLILHYDGASWSPMDSSVDDDLDDVWGVSGNDVFAVGGKKGRHVILHYDGSEWSVVHEGGPGPLLGLWGTASDDVFAVGGQRKADDDEDSVNGFRKERASTCGRSGPIPMAATWWSGPTT